MLKFCIDVCLLLFTVFPMCARLAGLKSMCACHFSLSSTENYLFFKYVLINVQTSLTYLNNPIKISNVFVMCSSVHPTHRDAVDQFAEISELIAAVPPHDLEMLRWKRKKRIKWHVLEEGEDQTRRYQANYQR